MPETILQIQKLLLEGKTTVVDRTLNYLERIESQVSLNAFLEVFRDTALKKAEDVDKQAKAGIQGKLSGLVIGIKDNICYKGHHVSAASHILEEYISPYSATVVERILQEGAVIIGRLNCDEFAMGGSNENSAFGPVLNPRNLNYVAGGSSGGSAAAVAAGLCDAALGSDTGGSIRQPASFCGVTGLKPTYGRVSRYGLIAYGSSFDQIGPLTHSVEDAARILEVISGPDQFDSTLSDKKVPAWNEKSKRKAFRLAEIGETLNHPSLDKEIADRFRKILDSAQASGHKLVQAHFPWLDYIVPAYYTLAMAEASSNLARYDGVHYGYRSPNAGTVEEVYTLSRTEGFGAEVKRRIMAGNFVLSSGYYDAYYSKAQKVRRIIRDATLKIFENADFIITPCTTGTAFKLGEFIRDPVQMYLQDIFTVHANLCGIPAICIPAGIHSNGLPYGIQVTAAPFEEQKLLAFAGIMESEMAGLES